MRHKWPNTAGFSWSYLLGYLTLRRLPFLTFELACPGLFVLPSQPLDLGWSLPPVPPGLGLLFGVLLLLDGCHPWLSSPVCPLFVGLKSEFSALLGGFCQQTSSTCSARLYRQALGRSQSRRCYRQGVSRADATFGSNWTGEAIANILLKTSSPLAVWSARVRGDHCPWVWVG